MSELGKDNHTPWWPCQCGGQYALGFDDGQPICLHTVPVCARYEAASDTDQIVRFSEENRKARIS